jgi:processive 1,2-diacylglycerol beta-glucosyltransferase
LVLTSSTGGGHDTRARALRDWAARERPGWVVELHQALEETHWIYGVGVTAYNIIQRTWPALHHVYYNILEAVSFCGGQPKAGDSAEFMPGRKKFMDVVRKARPDVVVSTHDHLNHGFFSAARAALPAQPPKCATYCGELYGGYGFSRHWVNPQADLFIGAVKECCEAARGLGMPAERTWRGDFLLDPSFWAPRDAAGEEKFLREELKLEPGRLTLLLSTGGNSAQNHLALLEALVAGGPLPGPAQVVALCGDDAEALKTVEVWAAAHPELPVRGLPRTRSMAQLMRVSSAVVGRPGTGTTSEAILSGAPMLFNTLGGIMPQEMITVKYGREHGFGRVVRRPGDLAEVVRGWLREPESLAAERGRVAAVRPVRTPADILGKLEELAGA